MRSHISATESPLAIGSGSHVGDERLQRPIPEVIGLPPDHLLEQPRIDAAAHHRGGAQRVLALVVLRLGVRAAPRQVALPDVGGLDRLLVASLPTPRSHRRRAEAVPPRGRCCASGGKEPAGQRGRRAPSPRRPRTARCERPLLGRRRSDALMRARHRTYGPRPSGRATTPAELRQSLSHGEQPALTHRAQSARTAAQCVATATGFSRGRRDGRDPGVLAHPAPVNARQIRSIWVEALSQSCSAMLAIANLSYRHIEGTRPVIALPVVRAFPGQQPGAVQRV